MKKILLIATSFLFITITSFAQTLILPGDGNLKQAITDAANGDVLQLLGGAEYTESTDLLLGRLVDKSIIIEAESGAMDKPIVKFTRAPGTDETGEFFNLGNNSSLTLKGIIFDGGFEGKAVIENLIQFYMGEAPATTNVGSIKLLDCEIMNLTGNVIDGMNSSMASYVVTDSTFIDNSIFTNTGTVLMYKYSGANFISMTNSTFHKITSYGIRIAGPGYTALYDNTPTVIVDHTTWHDIGSADGREILLLEKGPNVNPWTVTNNIFSLQVNKDKTCVNIKETTNDALATVLSNAFWQVGVLSWRSHTVQDTITTDPQFADPDNGDFTIAAGNVLLTYGTDGGAIGDPRWAVNAVGVEQEIGGVPSEFNLVQNYPNPFNPTTTINFDIVKSGNVQLKVYNILGSEVATLVNKQLAAGSYKYEFDASNLPSGVYIYTLNSGNISLSRKMVLTK